MAARLVEMAKVSQVMPGYKDLRLEASSPWNPANVLVTTDYDFTCTEEESCEVLVRAKENAMRITDCRVMKAYLRLWDEYEQLLEEHMATGQAGSSDESASDLSVCGGETLSSQHLGLDPRLEPALAVSVDMGNKQPGAPGLAGMHFDSTGLRKALGRLASLELAINGKVMAAGLLSGLSRGAIRSAGKRIALQPGCIQLLSRFASLGTAIHVISANWSRDLVYGGLSPISGNFAEPLLFVHCNDLEFDANGLSTGWFQNTVTNASDKERVQQALRKVTGPEKMVVYFGDDQPDALALLDADLGIVMGATDALCTLLDHHHIQLRPLGDAAALLATGSISTFRQTGILFQASGWDDVCACFFGAASRVHASPEQTNDISISDLLLPTARLTMEALP